MSVLSVLVFITQGSRLRRGYSQKPPDDATHLELFFRILVGQEKCPSKLFDALEQGLYLIWEQVYDLVNPFGDRRGGAFNSVWTFDLDKDVLLLTKEDRLCSAPLELARERLLTLGDFKLVSSPSQTLLDEQTLPGPFWEPKLHVSSRARAFIGQLLRDFAFTWRHVLRRKMNSTTFLKLAYATIWILRMDFTIVERIGFDYITDGGPYVKLIDLPGWRTPEATLVRAGSSWFALARDVREGIEMVQRHRSCTLSLGDASTNVATYAILTLRHVTLCKAEGNELVWTRSETLFGDIVASDAATDMLLWATNTTGAEPQLSSINCLPTEVQDRILSYAEVSAVAAAKLGCDLGLGSPFSWSDGGVKIRIEDAKRHRFEGSPVESHIFLNGVMSGLSYKRERGYQAICEKGTPTPILNLNQSF
ncbi:hypothetical protein NOR_07430 [Metarhizium rileyi]|uniref:Uncharacterized protein n=1 Tax=Metarhizium rileyi (strain RCEF 4871) TaxID=1649241 RepID=A0A166Y8B5_METRR|nr:hypothetical protein NOR_07430 [Metarhizium rileyi RCEF 4871]